MFCSKCGKELDDDALFCTSCGASANDSESSEGGAAAVKTSGKKTLIILAAMIAAFFLILTVFFAVMRNLKKDEGNSNASLADKPFTGFAGGLNIGDKVVFGKYEQDCNTANGAEPLEWDVIGKKGSQYLLITHYVIDYKQYDDGTADVGVNAGGSATDSIVTWEKCSLRKWLNSDFYSSTFTDEERSYITPVKNYNASWKEFDNGMLGASDTAGGYGGNVTEDKVFLLSVQELPAYLGPVVVPTGGNRDHFLSALASATPYTQSLTETGLCLGADEVFGDESVRNDPDSWYRQYYEGYVDMDYMQKEAFMGWFTRSPGCYEDSSAAFCIFGNGGSNPSHLKSDYGGVRPVVWVTVD